MVRIVDATLREGEQTPGVCFSRHTKLAIAQLLDDIGVDIIEAGHPTVSDDVRMAVESIARRSGRAKVGAHARSLEPDVALALDCGVDFLGIFFCVSDERLRNVFGKSLDDAARQVSWVIELARSRSPNLEIRYTPEDAVRSPFENVLRVSAAAVEAGADVISVADTTGCMVPGTPDNLYDYVSRLRDALGARNLEPAIAVHCHNDRGLALANALDGIRAGAEIVDATVLGLGERAGIVDLASLLTLLHERGDGDRRLDLLPELYRVVAKEAGVTIPVNQPMTGANAFTHCAGVHTQAALRNPLHYQSLDPALFGRSPGFCLDHMAGLAAVIHAFELIGEPEPERGLAEAVLADVKRVGQKGRRVELHELPYMIACHQA